MTNDAQFIPAHISSIPVPKTFFDSVEFARSNQNPIDYPSVDVGYLISRFIDISCIVQRSVLRDGKPKTTATLQQMIELDSDFASWELGLKGPWLYRTETTQDLPPEAVFQGRHHVYFDLWFARMWGYYRWARILLNQMILSFANSNPMSSLPLQSANERDDRFRLIKKLARDILVSAPSHWRHPSLTANAPKFVVEDGGAGSGAAGVPILLFHLKAAACAPGVPLEYWEWAQGIIECIWADMGMLHAKSMMDAMRTHRDGLLLANADGVLAQA